MKAFGSWVVKFLALWVAMAAATIGTGMLMPPPPAAGVADGPVGALTALMSVTGIGALVLAGLASRLTGTGWRRFAILFAVLFGVETGLSWIEAVFFNDFVKLSGLALINMAVSGLIKAGISAAAATLLWRRPGEAERLGAIGWVRPALVAGLYVLIYFTAGFLVAWSNEAVRAYYGDGLDIEPAKLALFQLGRGAIWTGLAVLLAMTVRGRTLTVAGLVGAAFAVLMAAPLLYPNALMPWPVRQAHLIELALANFAFGILAILMLRRRVG